MNCHFTVGQRVVCIDGDWPNISLSNDERRIVPCNARVPMINEVLTIVRIRAGALEDTKGAIWLYFKEIEGGWNAPHFRPLVERNTDISIFTDMLIEQKHPVQA